MLPYCRIDTFATWKKLHFISLDLSDFHIIDNLSIAVHAFARHILTSLSSARGVMVSLAFYDLIPRIFTVVEATEKHFF